MGDKEAMTSCIVGLEVKAVELEFDAWFQRGRLLRIVRQPVGKRNILDDHQSLSWRRHEHLVGDH